MPGARIPMPTSPVLRGGHFDGVVIPPTERPAVLPAEYEVCEPKGDTEVYYEQVVWPHPAAMPHRVLIASDCAAL